MPPDSCIQPGDTGNELGIGTYCSPDGQECLAFNPPLTCLADLGQDEWFCTRIFCKTTDECGSEVTCLMQDLGSACVPDRCLNGSGGTGGGTGGGGGAGGSGGAAASGSGGSGG